MNVFIFFSSLFTTNLTSETSYTALQL